MNKSPTPPTPPTPPTISFIIPAHNEQDFLADTLTQLQSVISTLQLSAEILVVNDDSNDDTAQIARDSQVKVIDVKLRQIAAVRNAGAAIATGEIFFFIDADTHIPPEVVEQALERIGAGDVGGGTAVTFDETMRFDARFFLGVWNFLSRWRRWAAGCFVFCTRKSFNDVGGFDEQYFAAEEIYFSNTLKKQGRFTVLKIPVITSSRKLHQFGILDHLKIMIRVIFTGGRALQKREGLNVWYDDYQTEPDTDLSTNTDKDTPPSHKKTAE